MGASRGFVIGCALLSALAGCSGAGNFRQTMGLEAPAPDEFLVVARGPLATPPDFTSLPPPQPGAPSLTDPDARRSAQAALSGVGASGGVAAAPSQGEQSLVAALAPQGAPADIRATVAAERTTPPRRFGLDSLFGVPIVQDPSADSERLSAEQEAERLREAGKPAPSPTTTQVPPAN
jgi:hypothetical protein